MQVAGEERAPLKEGGMDVLVMLEDGSDHPLVLAHVNSVPSSLNAERPSRDVVTLYGEPSPESLALVLAAVGLYSVVAYATRQRVKEIGIRMALGADRVDVLRSVVLDGLRPTLFGIGLGTVAAISLSHVLATLIYGVEATDASTYVAVAAVLGSVGLLASIIPAYRATLVDPVRTLRDE